MSKELELFKQLRKANENNNRLVVLPSSHTTFDSIELALEVLDIIVNDMHFHHVFNDMKLVFKRTVKEDRFNKVEKFLGERK